MAIYDSVFYVLQQGGYLNLLGYSEISTEDWSMQESFIYSSLWQYKQEKFMIIRKKYVLLLLLLLAGDIEQMPGPVDRIIPELANLLKKA